MSTVSIVNFEIVNNRHLIMSPSPQRLPLVFQPGCGCCVVLETDNIKDVATEENHQSREASTWRALTLVELLDS